MNTIYILDFLPSFPLPDKWMQMKKHLVTFFQINKQQTEEIDLYFHTAISVKGCKWVRGKSAHTDGFMCSQWSTDITDNVRWGDCNILYGRFEECNISQ